MGEIADLGRAYLRKYSVNGNGASPENKPSKEDGRKVFEKIDTLLSEEVVNRTTAVAALTSQMEASDAALAAQIQAAADGVVVETTWAALAANSGTRNGQPGRVTGPDAGTHTDPVVGGTVDNIGEYRWDTGDSGWQRTGDYVDLVAVPAVAEVANARFGMTAGVAVQAGGAWTVSWSGLWVQYEGLIVNIDDLAATELTSGGLVYIDVTGDTAPYAPVVAVTSSGLRADFAAGRKIQLVYNATGTLVGPLADTLLLFDSKNEIATARFGRADLKSGIQTVVPGHSLRALKKALQDPLVQVVGIVYVGDSITWGLTLLDNAVSTPRDNTLTDPRDNFETVSWANELKRYLGEVYAEGATPVISNWATSPSGEAIAEYERIIPVYPARAPFTVTINGGSTTSIDVADAAALLGFQRRTDIGASDAFVDFDFTFTGTTFDLHYASVSSETNADYELYVDAALIGTYSTSTGVDGAVTGSDNSRTHTFDFVRDAPVKIRARQKAPGGTLSRFRPTAIVVPKIIRITNNGIIGISARNYFNNALSGSFGGVAIGPEDTFVFCQLGTNDRGKASGTPWGPTAFRQNLDTLVGQMLELAPEVILMCANPTTEFDPVVHMMEMLTIRGVIAEVAEMRNLDFIDNYSIFRGVDLGVELADGLHPNELGHARIAENIIGRLEGA